MKTITITQQEIWMAMRPAVQKNKKKYTRKEKHKDKYK
jgi:hypothetical protein